MGQYQILKTSCNLPKSCTKKTITWKRTEQFFKIVDTNLPENLTSVWLRAIMCRLNQSFNLHPWATPRAFEFFENYCSNSSLPEPNAVQMPHTRVHSGDQMPPPEGHLKTFHVIHHVGAHDLESADRLQ